MNGRWFLYEHKATYWCHFAAQKVAMVFQECVKVGDKKAQKEFQGYFKTVLCKFYLFSGQFQEVFKNVSKVLPRTLNGISTKGTG